MVATKNPPVSLACAIGVLVVAAAIRIRAAQNSLWLDEIWSIDLVGRISSPFEIFLRIHSDSNHYLNSLWLYWAGARGDWPGYRIPSLAAGIGTVGLAGLIGRGRSRASGLIALLVTGFSYVLILYASEARGYATLVFFSFLCFYLLDRYLKTQHWVCALLFSVCASLGFISHLTFAIFFAASLPWAALRLIRARRGFRGVAVSLAFCYVLPAAVMTALYVADLRFLVVNGGATPGLARCAMESFAWTLGRPPGLPVAASCAAAAACFVVGLWMLARTEPDAILLFAGTVAVVPPFLVIVSHSDVLYVRYFIVPIAFVQLLLGFSLASIWERWGTAGRGACCLFLAGYLIANGLQVSALFKWGRGNNAVAIRLIQREARSDPVTVGGTQDFRIGTVVDYFARTEAHGRPLRYFAWGRWPEGGVEWLISEKDSYEDSAPPAPAFGDSAGNRYELFAQFPTAPLSGLQWFVYRHRGM